MTLKELEKMAQETAAFGVHPSGELIYSFYTEQLQAFASLIAQHEREACAEVCIAQMQGKSIWMEGAKACSLAIRARGQA